MTPEQLVEIPGIGEKMVEKIHQSVALYFENLEALATQAPGEAGTEAALVDEATVEAEQEVATTEQSAEPDAAPVDVAVEAVQVDEATEEATEQVREAEIGETEDKS